MMRTRLVFAIVLLAAAALAGLGSAQAEIYLVQVRHADARQVMGQQIPASTDTVRTWFAADKARMESSDGTTVLMRGDQSMVYVLNQEEHTYVQMPLDPQKMMEAMTEGQDPEAAKAMQSMLSNMMSSMQVTVTPTDEHQKIRDWNARKYTVEIKMPMGSTTSEIWATPDVEFDTTPLQRMGLAMSGQMINAEAMLKEMKKIEGLEVNDPKQFQYQLWIFDAERRVACGDP